jgi:RPA family protein
MKIAKLFILAMLCSAGCSRLREEVSPRVSDILSNPRKYEGKEVHIAGTVTEAFSIYRAGYFRVDDGSGSMVVFSTQISPRQGQHIDARGMVEQAYTIGNNQVVVLVEKTNQPEPQKVLK